MKLARLYRVGYSLGLPRPEVQRRDLPHDLFSPELIDDS